MLYLRKISSILGRIAVAIVLFLVVERLCHKVTQGFSLLNITDPHPFDERWEIAKKPSEEELKEIKTALNQPYKIVNAGGQNYAFASKDNKYILKITKHQNMRVPIWARSVPLPHFLEKRRVKTKIKKKHIFDQTFKSYMIAEKHLAPYSGIVYLHLNKTGHLHTTVPITDFIGNTYLLNIDDYEFILQKKGTLTFDYLDTLIKTGQMQNAKEALQALLYYTAYRINLGLEDHDSALYKNFGFYEGTPFQIDIGSLRFNETLKNPGMFAVKLEEVAGQLREWAEKSHPELFSYIQEISSEINRQKEEGTLSLESPEETIKK